MNGGFDLGGLMKQMQGFKSSMEDIKKSLAEKTVEGSAGGGIVKAVVNGNHKVQKIMISDEIIEDNDKEMLEEMVVAAINDAFSRVEEMTKTELGKVAGSMGLPLDGLM